VAVWVLIEVAGMLLAKPAAAMDYIENSGNVVHVLIPAVAFGTTFYMHDSEGRKQFYEALAANLIVTIGLKYAIDKKRPDGSDHSFPSEHTSTSFQGAAFIHRRYDWEYGIPAYLGASFVGYSRVESDKHYIEDVIAGAAIGAISSFFVVKPYKGAIIAPVASGGCYGISLSIGL
jgi:membrane-associated phospholipid phosphatase